MRSWIKIKGCGYRPARIRNLRVARLCEIGEGQNQIYGLAGNCRRCHRNEGRLLSIDWTTWLMPHYIIGTKKRDWNHEKPVLGWDLRKGSSRVFESFRIFKLVELNSSFGLYFFTRTWRKNLITKEQFWKIRNRIT